MVLYRDGEQLGLRFKGWPWEGQHPRVLTRGFFFCTFAARGAPAELGRLDAVQLELFPEGTHYGTCLH